MADSPEWLPLTELLDEAVKGFKLGQLIQAKSMSLQTAMQAIELMDPKMDSGMALPGTDSITVEQVFAQQLVKLGGHTTDELVALLDDLAVAEMRHVAGDMLSQSVLTWAQMHRPYDMVEPVLKGFCLSVLFAVHTMHTRVAAAGVAEEEDRLYEGEAFGYVAAFKAEDEVLLVLDKAEQDASARSDALGHRIAVRKLWLKLLIQLGKEGSSDKSVLETTAQLKATLKAVKSTITAEGPRSEGCFPSLTRALSTHAPPRPSGSFNRLQAYEYFEHVVGYLEGICHMTQATSLTELLRLVDHLCGAQPTAPIFVRSQLKLTMFVTKELDDPLLFGKTSLYKQVLPHEMAGLTHAPFALPANLPESYAPPLKKGEAAPKKPVWAPFVPIVPPGVRENVDAFLPTLAKNVVELFRVRFQNRARYRRRLKRVIGEWDQLQVLAESVDLSIQTQMLAANEGKNKFPIFLFNFSSIVYINKIRMMADYLLLGFELDMYRQHEYPMIFCYVDYLFETESLQRQSIVHHLTADSEAYGTSLRTAIAAAKSVAKRNALIEIATMPYPQSTLAEYILLLVRQSIVRGVIRLMLALHFDKLLDFKHPEFGSEEINFAHRFEAFASISGPALMPYEQFVNGIWNVKFTSTELYAMASDTFSQAKRLLERYNKHTSAETESTHSEAQLKQIVTSLGRVIISNTLFNVQHTKAPFAKVRMEFKQHPYLPIFVGSTV